MKKSVIFGLVVASFAFASCGDGEDILGDYISKGMTLNAHVAKASETRASIEGEDGETWTFLFTDSDEVKVTNTAIESYYTFVKAGDCFRSPKAEPTATEETWYAYYPSQEVSLSGQKGTLEDVAKRFALAGQTESPTTGRPSLTIAMEAQVAILKVVNEKGPMVINAKNSATTWVTGLKARSGEKSYDLVTATTQTTLFSTWTKGTYYVVVPAGVQLSIKDDAYTIRSTVATGLTAGKYYQLTLPDLPDPSTEPSVDLGLSVEWATHNVGTTVPQGIGWFVAWGELKPNKSLGILSGYTMSDYKWARGSSWTKYCGTDHKRVLDPDDDLAHVEWGGQWRIPSVEEAKELVNEENCTWTKETLEGKKGYRVTSKINNNSIFLPFTGVKGWGNYIYQDTYGDYWLNSLQDGSIIYANNLQNDFISWNQPREYGRVVRPVRPRK